MPLLYSFNAQCTELLGVIDFWWTDEMIVWIISISNYLTHGSNPRASPKSSFVLYGKICRTKELLSWTCRWRMTLVLFPVSLKDFDVVLAGIKLIFFVAPYMVLWFRFVTKRVVRTLQCLGYFWTLLAQH